MLCFFFCVFSISISVCFYHISLDQNASILFGKTSSSLLQSNIVDRVTQQKSFIFNFRNKFDKSRKTVCSANFIKSSQKQTNYNNRFLKNKKLLLNVFVVYLEYRNFKIKIPLCKTKPWDVFMLWV